MSRFYSETNRPRRITQPITSRYEDVYEERIDTKTGKPYLKKIKQENVYEKIQIAAEGVTLKEIIKRYNIDPTESAKKIESTMGEIMDYTTMPENIMEVMDRSIEAKNIFELAAPEIKGKFNNNYTEFLAAANNGTLKKVLSDYLPKEAPVANTTNTTTPTVETTPTQTTQGVKYE